MYYKQTRYFSHFQCIGSECFDNCCYGWQIFWKKSEIDKVLGAENISDELRKLVEDSFDRDKDNENKLKIKFRDDGQCPFQTKDKLCMIQKELGAEYLSNTCMVYPRSAIYANTVAFRFCHMTCPVVMNSLLNDKTSMDLVSTEIKGKTYNTGNDPNDVKKYPVQKYRAELFEFFYEILSDKKLDIDSALILGALAANVLTKIEESGDLESIPEQIKALRKQIHDGKMLRSLDNIKPNPQIKFSFLPKITEQLTGRTTTVLLHNSDGTLNTELYALGEQRLREALHGRGYFLRNVVLSLIFELDLPFKLPKRTIAENYSLFVTVYACIKLNLIGALAHEKSITMHTHKQQFCYEGDGKLTGLTALICRGLCQSTGNSEKIIDLLKANGYDRPAYLALFVK